jgi:serine/threonine protein phosphatase PrpC
VGEPCPHCAAPTGTTDQFCEGCGVDLRVRRRDRTDRVEIDLGALAGVSDRGRVHVRNEDAMALGHGTAVGHETAVGQRTAGRSAARLAAVVCDGVSTVHSPELASRAAAESALDVLLSARSAPDRPAEHRTRDAVAAAARAVAALPAPSGRDAPSCTLVSALVDRSDPDLPEITVAWVGDSRAYWLAGAGAAEPARLLTADHSWVAEMVAAGVLDVATAMADVRAHAITQWLGADGEPEPGVVTLRPAGSGALLLCSDGLWNYLPDADGLAAVAVPTIERGTGALDAAAALTAVALAGGGRDNITAVVIPITVRSPS